MNFALEQLTQPEIEVLTLPEVKRHLGEFDDVTDNDADLTELIRGAREWVEGFTGRILVDESWRLTLGDDRFVQGTTAAGTVVAASGAWAPRDDGGIWLRRSPILAISSVNSIAADGTVTDLDPVASYVEVREALSRWPRLHLLAGTWSGNYRIEFRAGFADRTGSPQTGADVVPVRFKTAMKLWIQAAYQPDEKSGDILKIAENFIRPERAELGMA